MTPRQPSVAARLLARLGRAPARDGSTIPTACLRRLLVLAFGRGPDELPAFLPQWETLRDGLPHRRIDLAASEALVPALVGRGLADQLVAVTPAQLSGWWPTGASRWWLWRRTHYDAVLDFSAPGAAGLAASTLARWSGAAVRIGHAGGAAPHHLTHVVDDEGWLTDPLGIPRPVDGWLAKSCE